MIARKRLSSGFSLIEILITMAMGIVMLGGLLQILSINSENFRIRDSLSRVQEDGRLAIELMSRELRHSGFRAYPYTDRALIDKTILSPDDSRYPKHRLFKAIDGAFKPADDIPVDTPIYGNSTSSTDNVIMRYQVENFAVLKGSVCGGSFASGVKYTEIMDNLQLVTDSNGNGNKLDEIGVNAVATAKFYVSNNILYCDARLDYYSDSSDTIKMRKSQALPLFSNVENLRILYGIDSNGDNSPNRYVNESRIADSDWGNVKAVRIALILRTEEKNLSNTDTQTPLLINGEFRVAIKAVKDRRLYRVFSTTIMLRNMVL